MPRQVGPSPSGGHAYRLVDLFRYLGCFRAELPSLHAGARAAARRRDRRLLVQVVQKRDAEAQAPRSSLRPLRRHDIQMEWKWRLCQP